VPSKVKITSFVAKVLTSYQKQEIKYKWLAGKNHLLKIIKSPSLMVVVGENERVDPE